MAENSIVTLEVDITQAENGIVKVTKNLTDLKKTAGEISKVFSNAFNPLLEKMGDVVDGIGELTGFITTASQMLENYFGQLSIEPATEAIGGAADSVTSINELLGATIEGVVGATAGFIAEQKIPEIVLGIKDLIKTIGKAFGSIAGGAAGTATSIAGIVLAILAVIAAVITLAMTWEEYGAQWTQGFNDLVNDASESWWGWRDTIVLPVLESVATAFDDLWTLHLKGLHDSITEGFSSMGENLKALWDNCLAPFIHWITEVVGPIILTVIDTVLGAVRIVIGFVSDVISVIIGFLDGLIQFIVGIFTLDFKKAWEGIGKMFKNAVMAFGAILIAGVNGVILLLNTIISAIYSVIVGVLNLVGGIVEFAGNIAGKEWGFSFSTKPPQIPLLAQGAVLPANKPFLAVVGDQKHGTNVEAPLDTIKQAVAEVLAGQGGGDVVINFTGDLAQLARVLKPVIDRENRRVGGSLAKGLV